MSTSKKRASPGAEAEAEATLSDADAQKLAAVAEEGRRAELVLERRALAYLEPYYARRRAVLRAIPQFWPHALARMGALALHVQHAQDQAALAHLADVWVVRAADEPRCFTLEFHFTPNPFFADAVLRKEYKYIPPPADAAAGADADADAAADADGVTAAAMAFSWERDVAPQKTAIAWKDAARDLTALHPRVAGADADDDLPADPGSFFNFFTHADDPFDIGMAIASDLFPEAIDYFTGQAGDAMEFDDDSEDEDEENDEDEIDLEKPRKKQKTA